MDHIDTLEPLIVEDRLDRPFIAAGDRAYLIGHQDGSFPDMGFHVEGEMGGIWTHPIKLLDGVWLRVDDVWLSRADQFRIGPWWAEHRYDLGGLQVVRREFIPDGAPAVVIRYLFQGDVAEPIRVRVLARSDLRSVWGPEPAQAVDAPDRAAFIEDLGVWECHKGSGSRHAVIGAVGRVPDAWDSGAEIWGPEKTLGNGISVWLEYELKPEANKAAHLDLAIAGSHEGLGAALAAYRRVSTRLEALEDAKARRIRTMLATTTLEVPEPSLTLAWDWLKCGHDWLVREVRGIGRGLGAGVADYPWWFGCDNGYALRGCLALGQHDIAIDTLDLLRELSDSANGRSGRVIHEANTWGLASNPGNTQETPHFVRAVWDTFRWTGDVTVLARNYDFCKRGLLGWTLTERCRDGDPLPYGYGIMEMLGLDLQCIDTASLTVEALAALAQMADVLGEPEVAARCRDLYAAVRGRLEEAFWMEEEGLYGDVAGTSAEMVPRLRHWMAQSTERNPAASERFGQLLREAESDRDQHRKRPWLLKNWSVLCPLEAGLTESGRARRTLERAEGEEFTGPWGVYISGIERRAMMSIATGVMAVAEITYRRVDQALRYIQTLTDQLGMQMPGAISEMSPDYGCFLQAWSSYGVAWPVVTGIFGVQPDAGRRHLTLAPCFPESWPAAELRNIRMGTNSIDLRWDGATLWVTSQEPGWSVSCHSVPAQAAPDSVPLALQVAPEPSPHRGRQR